MRQKFLRVLFLFFFPSPFSRFLSPITTLYFLICVLVRYYVRLIMPTLSASEARANLYRLIDEAADSHEPIRITGKRNNAVLVSEDDWAAVQETLYLLSIPGMRESIREGLETPVDQLDDKLEW